MRDREQSVGGTGAAAAPGQAAIRAHDTCPGSARGAGRARPGYQRAVSPRGTTPEGGPQRPAAALRAAALSVRYQVKPSPSVRPKMPEAAVTWELCRRMADVLRSLPGARS